MVDNCTITVTPESWLNKPQGLQEVILKLSMEMVSPGRKTELKLIYNIFTNERD